MSDDDEQKTFFLDGYLKGAMVLNGVLAGTHFEDEDELNDRVWHAIHVLIPSIVGDWQLLSDDGQQKFLADHPEHEEALKAFLVIYAEETGKDMAEMTTQMRGFQKQARRIGEEDGR